MTTRENILDASLDLFSRYGYDGTSMEMIADKARIKAPSIYKHFRGKEEILDLLIDRAEERYEKMFGSEDDSGDIPVSMEDFTEKTLFRVSFTMKDEMIRKMRIFLVKEQFRNERIALITSRHQLEGITAMFSSIIEKMMDGGLLRRDDPDLLALELTSPAVVLIAKSDREPGNEEEMLDMIEDHIRHFCDTYKA